MTEKTEADNTALAHFQGAPSDDQIEAIRQAGRQTVAMMKETNELYRMIEGMEWGAGSSAVKGSSFSPATRYALAKFCSITGAQPMTQVDILGGKPYLNANFWSDKCMSDPYFLNQTQVDISPSTEEYLRTCATEHHEAALVVKDSDPDEYNRLNTMRLDYIQRAQEIADKRARWSAPSWAKVVIETTIDRLIPIAPVEAIRAGTITDLSQYTIQVTECNWAGGRPKKSKRDGGEYQPDPVGEEEPEKTARTRSMRRTASKTFSAWAPKWESQVQLAQEAIEAEWETITEEAGKDLEAAKGAGLTTGDGEPKAASAEGATEIPTAPVVTLPVVPVEPVPPAYTPPPPIEPTPIPADAFNVDHAREVYFGGLKAAGIPEVDRVKFQTGHDLPGSTKDWSREHYDQITDILLPLAKDRYEAMCEVAGRHPGDLAMEVLEHEPGTLSDYYRLTQDLTALGITPDGEK